MARTDPQINFRLPAGVKDFIYAIAKANKRSVSAEIVERLTGSITLGDFDRFAKQSGLTDDKLNEWLKIFEKETGKEIARRDRSAEMKATWNIEGSGAAKAEPSEVGGQAQVDQAAESDGCVSLQMPSHLVEPFMEHLAQSMGYSLKKKPE